MKRVWGNTTSLELRVVLYPYSDTFWHIARSVWILPAISCSTSNDDQSIASQEQDRDNVRDMGVRGTEVNSRWDESLVSRSAHRARGEASVKRAGIIVTSIGPKKLCKQAVQQYWRRTGQCDYAQCLHYAMVQIRKLLLGLVIRSFLSFLNLSWFLDAKLTQARDPDEQMVVDTPSNCSLALVFCMIYRDQVALNPTQFCLYRRADSILALKLVGKSTDLVWGSLWW